MGMDVCLVCVYVWLGNGNEDGRGGGEKRVQGNGENVLPVGVISRLNHQMSQHQRPKRKGTNAAR